MTQNNHFWLIGLFLSLSFSLFSQVTYEATYPTTNLHRVNWAYGGEKYWYADDSLKEIKIFSAQHTHIRTISYPSVPNAQVQLLQGDYGVTQNTINPDNLLEMVWMIKDTVLKQEKLQIRNEVDSVLLSLNNRAHIVSFNEIQGLPSKLFITNLEEQYETFVTRVYSLPNTQLENIFFRSYYLHRKKFGYAGEKYFYKDKEKKKMQVYNADFSFWKSVNLAWFSSISLDDTDNYTDADDNTFSKDSLIEVSFSYANSTGYGNIILSENGKKYNPNKTDFIIDKTTGLDEKILEIDWSTINPKYRLLKLIDFVPKIEFESFYPINRFLSKNYGEVIVSHTYPLTLLYNSNQNKRKFILPSNDTFSIYNFYYNPFVYFDDSIINRDTLFEVVYTEKHYNIENYRLIITNDTTKIYQIVDNTRYFNIANTKGLLPKLFTKTGNNNPYNTKVWRLGNELTPIKDLSSVFDLKIYPNPSQDEMNLELVRNTEGSNFNITVCNMLGQNVFSAHLTNVQNWVLKKSQIGAGVFMVTIKSGQISMSKKIVFD